MKTGIYMIRNKINDKKYIGQSKDIDRRWDDHISELNSNKHYNQYLQNAWNKYGADNFEFNVVCQIDEYDKVELNELEVYYIKKYKSKIEQNGYNQSDGGDGWSSEYAKMMCNRPEYLEKLRQATIDGMKKSGTFNGKLVYCVNNNTVYESIGEASKKLDIDNSYISWCCNGKSVSVPEHVHYYKKGSIVYEFWLLSEWENLTELEKSDITFKNKYFGKIYCVNNDSIYDSDCLCSLDLNLNLYCIRECCEGKHKMRLYPDGHHYKPMGSKEYFELWYALDWLKLPYDKKSEIRHNLEEDNRNRMATKEISPRACNRKRVYCVTLNTIYSSCKEAEEKLKLPQSYASYCCKGKHITEDYPDGHHIKGLELWYLSEYEEKFGKVAD